MILDEIVAHKREEVARQKAVVPLAILEDRIASMPPPRDFRAALRKDGISLIAEVKRASPSRGDLLPDASAAELAGLYEAAGASAISVLTDARYFKGCLQDLVSAHQNVRAPVLRKEFIIDPYQIVEARAAGADAVLLIVRILSDAELHDLRELAEGFGLGVLVETHSAEEVDRALAAGAHIVGINNRDLDTLDMNLETTMELRKQVPGGHVLVSESGIHTRRHVEMLEDGGVDAILVGESLLTSNDIRGKIRELLGRDES
jgi:indole-3-glycerol phosphate synthase